MTDIITEEELKAVLLAVFRRAGAQLDPPQMAGAVGEALAEYLDFLTGQIALEEEQDDPP